MCGIVGFQGEFPQDLLARMTQAVAHRGPDGAGGVTLRCHGQPPTGLGHRRLAIIDLSDAGLQPMTMACGPTGRGELTLIYNGEIYNYRELRAELIAAGHQIATATDSEILLHMYEAHGPGMVDRLNGIFALAIHDARERGRPDGIDHGALFIARDHLGVKPLYYADSPHGFVFGSEMKALMMDPGLDRSLDAAALHQTLAYLWTPAPRTVLRAIRKLEPGSAMIVSGGHVRRQWTYYTPPYTGQTSKASEQELARELADRLYTAVDRQLVSDVPVGAFLSGGLDSSSVVAMMRKARPAQAITAFTVAFEDEDGSDGNPYDLPYARKAAAHLGVSLQEVTVPASSILRLEEMIRLLDEPQADPAPINALMIAEQSRAMGIPVLLSGAGGDDIFGGYGRHFALQFERRWAWMPTAVRRRMQGIAQWAASGHGHGQSVPSVRRLAKMFAYAAESPDRRLISHFLWSTNELRRGLYTREFAQATAGMDVGEPLLRTLDRIPDEPDRLQRMLMLETVHFLADHNLNYTDRAGMAVAVEVRVPLLDLDLVAFAARLPASMKQAGRIGKPLFRKAMEPYLPHDVIYRPKTGFGAPLRRWLRHELREMVADTLSPANLRRRGIFDPAAVARLVEHDRRGLVDGSYTIFALLSFELWCRSFLDGEPGTVAVASARPAIVPAGPVAIEDEPAVAASPMLRLKGTVEALPETFGRLLAAVPFPIRFGPSYSRMRSAIARAERKSDAQQLAELRDIVDHAVTHTDFYRDFYRSRGFSVEQLRSMADWQRVPVVTKADLQTVPLSARSVGTDGIRINTGGTSGQPLEFYVEPQAFAREWAHMHHIWGARGYHWRALKLTLRGKHFDTQQPLRFNALHNEYVVNASCPMEDVVKAVLAQAARTPFRWLHGYPSLVAEFGLALQATPAAARRAFEAQIAGVLLGSEYPAPVYRDVIERTLSTNVVSWFGHSEMAVLAREIAVGVYESMPTYGFAEAVPDGSGEHRLVCTALHNRVHPFIRYETGDLIAPLANDGGPLRFRITEGRVGEFIQDRHGRRHSLTALIFGRHHPAFDLLQHVQVQDHGGGRVSLVVTPRRPGLDGAALRPRFDLSNVDIDWTIEVVQAPIRTASGKIQLLIQ